jgi:Na+-transporting methylmalonyl-CoA/oxaloacetate decarboxylase gamma subunit
MILLSSLMLLVAGVTVVACVTAILASKTVAGILAVARNGNRAFSPLEY